MQFEIRESRDGLSANAEVLIDGLPSGTATLTLADRGPEWRALIDLAGGEGKSIAPLLEWAESTAIALTRAVAEKPVLLCIDNPAESLLPALSAVGFALAVAEDEMARSASGAAPATLPAGLALLPWDEGAAPLFHHAYYESFKDRPGFPGWDEARWRSGFASDADFRPDLSRVILDGPEPAAFAVLWVEDGVGWIIQVGVRPQWRGKGLGEALVNHALNAFAAEGIATVSLEVATNNPAARALYERLGFRITATNRSWRKTLG